MPDTERRVLARRWLKVADRDLAVTRLCLGVEPLQAEVVSLSLPAGGGESPPKRSWSLRASGSARRTASTSWAGQVTEIDKAVGDAPDTASPGSPHGASRIATRRKRSRSTRRLERSWRRC
jgi:hypothetical protein